MGSGISGYRNDFTSRVKNPKAVGELLNITFPGNGQPNAFTAEEIDQKLKDWIAPYIIKKESMTKNSKVRLNSGREMPVFGLGTWTLTGQTCETAVYTAIKDGYRLIDAARYYGNEREVGNAVRKAIADGHVSREEVFVTTKIVPSGDRDYAAIIDECNAALGLGYIDLMLIHQSGSGQKKLYRAMEQAVGAGTVRSIGISNYYTATEFDDITEGATIMPAVVQNENHIYYQNTEFQQYVSQYGTVVESWYPFGGRGNTSESFNNPTIKAIAQAHGKTSAQVILRWHLQAGYIVIPGSSNPAHIAENIDIFDFSLTESEMQQIKAINKNKRYENW